MENETLDFGFLKILILTTFFSWNQTTAAHTIMIHFMWTVKPLLYHNTTVYSYC